MPRDDQWSASWCCDKLISHDKIIEARVITNNSIQLSVDNMEQQVKVVTMSSPLVDLDTVPSEIQAQDTEFLLNIKNDAFYSGALLNFAAGPPFGVGGLGDLYTAASEREFRRYVPKETRFLTRVFEQHSAVRAVVRDNDRTYRIFKQLGDEVTVLALNEYDLTGEAVRCGIQKYGLPQFILASNPNCQLTNATKEVAANVGTGVLDLRQLLGALNN